MNKEDYTVDAILADTIQNEKNTNELKFSFEIEKLGLDSLQMISIPVLPISKILKSNLHNNE